MCFGMFMYRLHFSQPLVLPFFSKFYSQEGSKITRRTGEGKEARLNLSPLLWMWVRLDDQMDSETVLPMWVFSQKK